MRFYSFIIIIFLIINRFAFSDFYFAGYGEEFGTNEAIKSPIIEDEQELASKDSTDTR